MTASQIENATALDRAIAQIVVELLRTLPQSLTTIYDVSPDQRADM